MKKQLIIKKWLLLMGFARALSAIVCHADFRYYAWTYQFVTMPPGDLNLKNDTTIYVTL